MLSLNQIDTYQEIFFDLDGVILDTNPIKARNIGEAVAFKGTDFSNKFVAYFTANNGIPREIKIRKYLSGEEAGRVLKKYDELNLGNLHEALPLPGVIKFFQHLNVQGIPIHVFTGGTEIEAVGLLEKIGLMPYFKGVYGGPRTKKENFDRQEHGHPILMFGDSRSDYEFAKRRDLDFVFVYGYTQFKNWRDFFNDRPIVGMIKDFSRLL